MIWQKYTSETHDHDHWVLTFMQGKSQGGVPKPGCKIKKLYGILYRILANNLHSKRKKLKTQYCRSNFSIFNK